MREIKDHKKDIKIEEVTNIGPSQYNSKYLYKLVRRTDKLFYKDQADCYIVMMCYDSKQ